MCEGFGGLRVRIRVEMNMVCCSYSERWGQLGQRFSLPRPSPEVEGREAGEAGMGVKVATDTVLDVLDLSSPPSMLRAGGFPKRERWGRQVLSCAYAVSLSKKNLDLTLFPAFFARKKDGSAFASSFPLLGWADPRLLAAAEEKVSGPGRAEI